MRRNPIFSFAGTASKGLENMPDNSPVLIEDSDGAGKPQLIFVHDITGITSNTSIADLLALTDQWTELGGEELALTDLTDVYDSMSPTDGQVLTFDDTNGWQAETTAEVASSLTDLTDVYDSMSPTDGQVLTFDDTNGWQSETSVAAASVIDDFTSTLDQTEFTTNYNPNNVSVYSGGVKMKATEYTASNGTSITLNLPQDEGTWISVISDDGTGGGTSVTWGNVSGTPTTLTGYGITDAYNKSEIYTTAEVDSAISTSTWDWSDIVSGTPTTLTGYGITDAYTKTEIDTQMDLVVESDITTSVSVPSGAIKVSNMIQCTQAEYDSISPDTNTVYVIVG